MDTKTETIKREYEIIYLMSPEISETDIDHQNKKLEEIINSVNGEITKTKPVEKKRLAYPIKKNRNAYSGVIHFNIDIEELPNLRKKIGLETSITRYLITKFEKFPEQPKISTFQKMKFKSEPVQPKKEVIAENEIKKPEDAQIKKAELAEIEKKLEEILNE